jgi:UDP-glucose 4-epimerase
MSAPVLVTGGAGFLGSALVDRLLAEGRQVDVVDNFSTGSLANLASARATASGALKIHQLDTRAEEIDELVARREPALIYHLALVVPGPGIVTAAESVAGTVNVLESARRNGVSRVVVCLPAVSLYGEVPPRELPVKEGRTFVTASLDSVLARAVADLLAVYRAEHQLEFSALAMTNVYGPRQRESGGVVAAFHAATLRHEIAEISGDGRQTRDFLFVDDAVDALVRAGSKGGGLVINIGTGIQTSVRDLADRLGVSSRLTGKPAGPSRFAVSSVRARIHLQWEAWTTLDDGLAQL